MRSLSPYFAFFFPVASIIFLTFLSFSRLRIFTVRLVVALVFCLHVIYHISFSHQAMHIEFMGVFLKKFLLFCFPASPSVLASLV